MLSRICTPPEIYDSPHDKALNASFSTTGTDFTDFPFLRLKSSNGAGASATPSETRKSNFLGCIWTKKSNPMLTQSYVTAIAQQSLHLHSPKNKHHHLTSKRAGLLKRSGYPNANHDQYARPRQEAVHCCLAPQPVYAIFIQFVEHDFGREQERRDSIVFSSHACELEGECDCCETADPSGSEVAGKRPDWRRWPDTKPSSDDARNTAAGAGEHLSSLSREVPRGRGQGCEERGSGGPFVRAAGGRAGRGRKEGEPFSVAEEGYFVLDGAAQVQDQGEGQQSGRKPDVSVKERVQALEAKGAAVPKGKEGLGAGKVASAANLKGAQTGVPIVYPLHYKRFVRRTSNGRFLGSPPGTPLYRSDPPTDNEERIIHAPRPIRSIPVIKTPPETPMPSGRDSAGGNHGESSGYSTFHVSRGRRRKLSAQFDQEASTQRITPASFLHGTRSHCVRHGRNRQRLDRAPSPKRATGVQDAFQKSRSGAYVPTGLAKMRQVDATSLWVHAGPQKPLVTRAISREPAGSSEVCPDCSAELRIKRRELMQQQQEIEATVKRPTDQEQAQVQSTTASGLAGPDWRSDSQILESYKQSSMLQRSKDDNLVVARDLGDGLDAVIVEHRGDLRQVVVNSRHGAPTIETMQHLSRELARVSDSVAFARVGHQRPATDQPDSSKERESGTMVSDAATPRPRDTRRTSSSVPELLAMIGQAASEIRSNSGKIGNRYVSRRDFATSQDRHSLLSSEEFERLVLGDKDGARPEQRLVERQVVDEHYRDLHERLTNASSSRESSIRAERGAAAPVTPQSSASGTRSIYESALATPSARALPTNQRRSMPAITRTKAPVPPSSAAEEHKIPSPFQTPPPEWPTLHHFAERSDLPTSEVDPIPTFPRPKVAAQESHHRSWFSHCGRRRTPHAAPAQAQNQPSTSLGQQALAPEPPVPITALPNPYHHAPTVPLDINYAAWVDDKVREQQQVIRAAMRMQKNRTPQEAAAAVERETRRMRSIVAGKEKGRREWFRHSRLG